MNFWVVTGQSFKGNVKRAVICEERALEWVRDELEKDCIDVAALPATCHWSAQVVPSRGGGDWDTRWEES